MAEDIYLKGNCLMVTIPSELDHPFAEKIKEDVDRELKSGRVRSIIFDFRNTIFMDSSGIGMIMGRYKTLRYMGGSVEAIHVSNRILRIMQLSGIHKFIPISQETVWNQKRK